MSERGRFVAVTPARCVLSSVEPGVRHVLTLVVRNVSTKGRRIRIFPPRSPRLRLVVRNDIEVAAGLELSAELSFLGESVEPLDDQLLVQVGRPDGGGETELLTIPVLVRPPCAQIGCEPAVDFGEVVLGAPVSRGLTLRNAGKRAGRIVFDAVIGQDGARPKEGATPQFRVTPAALEVPAGGVAQVRVECTACEPGELGGTVQLHVEGGGDMSLPPAVSLRACVIPQALELRDSTGGSVNAVDFGQLYWGREARRVLTAINTGPNAIDFAFLNPLVDADADPSTIDNGSLALTMTPAMGMLPPHSTCEVVASFRPVPKPAAATGFGGEAAGVDGDVESLSVELQIESVETGQTTALRLSGDAVKPKMKVSPASLVFGHVEQYGYVDRRMVLTNESKHLPLDFSVTQPANFSLTPALGTLPPNGSIELIVRFSPHQLGELKATARLLAYGGSVASTPIKLWGGCSVPRKRAPEGGVHKLPSDFVKPPRLIGFDETRSHRKSWTRPQVWDATAQLEESAVLQTLRSKGKLGGAHADEMLDRIDQSDTGFDLSAAEQIGKAEHRRQYGEFLMRTREARETALRARHTGIEPGDFCFGVSLGLEAFSGLATPWPELDTGREPVWLHKPYDTPGAPRPGAGRRAAVFDPMELVARKFKALPEEPDEVRECKQPLSPKELLAVVGGPRTIDFGTVTAGTTLSRSFSVINDLRASVLVEVRAADEPELAESWPPSQVIPSGASAGFDVTLRVDEPASAFRRKVSYVINGIHAFKFTVMAEVVPPELHLTSTKLAALDEIDFTFGTGDAAMTASRTLLLHNRGTAPAAFRWELPPDFKGKPAFRVDPEIGTVAARSKLSLTVTFHPQLGCTAEHALVCLVEGGAPCTLSCRAPGLAEAKLLIVDRVLSFGTNAVGVAQERIFTVRNAGATEAVFSIDPAHVLPGWTVTPLSAAIRPGSLLEVAVEAVSDLPAKLEPSLALSVRYGKPLKLPVYFEAIVPQASVREDDFEFGPVVVGSEAHQPLTLVNDSPIPAVLYCDLTLYPSFNLQLLANKEAELHRAEMDAAEVATTITALNDDESESPLQLISRAPDTANAAGDETEQSEYDRVSAPGSAAPADQRLYRITVPPNAELCLSLNFEPQAHGAVEFELPLELAGVPRCAELRRLVHAEGLRARLGVSTTRVMMGPRIVRDPALPYCTSIEIFSQEDEEGGVGLKWAVDTSALEGSGFHLPVTSGTLAPRGSLTLLIEFAPPRPMSVDVCLPLFLDGAQADPKAKPYLTLQLKATATRPRIEFDRSEVLLPPVPLGHVARASFYVLNQGYDNLELQGRITADTERLPLELFFPEGRLVGVAKQRLLVMVSFCSSRPISFTSRVELSDADGHRFSIPVSATSDGSVFTTQPYLSGPAAPRLRIEALPPAALLDKNGNPRSVKPGAAPPPAAIIIDTGELPAPTAEERSGAADANGVETTDGVDPAAGEVGRTAPPNRPLRSNTAVSDVALLRLANMALDTSRPTEEQEVAAAAAAAGTGGLIVALICSSILALPVDAGPFPAPLTASKAKATVDLLELLTGRRVPPPPAVTDRKNPKQVARSLLGGYDHILTFLRAAGGLLAAAKPDYLMPLPEFLKLAEAGVGTIPSTMRAGRLSRRRTRELSAEHAASHGPAWVEVLMQAIRALVFCRLTPKSFQAPPFPLTMPEQDLSALAREVPLPAGANAYSAPEALLLRWLETHWRLAHPDMPSLGIIDADSALRDGHVFAAVVASHVPSVAAAAAPAARGAPDQPAGRLIALTEAPCSAEAARANFKLVLETLRELGVPFSAGKEDAADYSAALASGTARELLLFALHLHQSLPHCVPKGTVRFAGGLHETVVKEIELTNPSAKPVEYDVRLYGSPAFSIDRKRPTKGAPATCHLRLEPRAAIKFAIEMSSAFTGATAGTLRFLSRGDGIGSSNASTLVFDLRAEVSIGQPMGVHAAEAKLYSPTTIALPVKPPPQLAAAFEGGGLVRVELFETRPPLEPTQPAGGGGRGGGRGKPAGRALGSPGKRVEAAGASGFDADGVAKRLPKSFWSSAATGSAALKLDAKGEAILSVQFIPFQLGEYSCTVWIADPAAGEWSYRITGRVGLPPPLETLNFACEMAQSTARELTLPYRNPQLERARLAVLDRSAKERERWSAVWGKDPIVRGQQALVGSSSSPAFSLPLKLDLVEAARPGGSASSRGLASRAPSAVPGTPRTGALGGAAVGGPDTNKLPLRFTPKEPGTYSGEVLLVSPLDVRMYQVHGTAKAPGIEATLEFVGPARVPLLQELPVVNGTDVEWNVTATLRGGDFSGPASIRVPPSSTGYFPLKFTPSWTEVCEGELTLTNSAVGDKYVYNLKGVGEEPLAEGHVVLDCTARKPKVLAFKVVNVSASGTSCEMKIDSDLLHVSGPPTVSVPGRAKSGSGGETSYQLTVNPLMGGTVQGSITFTAPDGRFLWYTVEIRAAPPPAERVIEVAAPLRKVVAVEIPITNPSSSALEFSVSLIGDALYGETSIVVPAGPGTSSSYELFYSPLTAGEAWGSVAFLNEEAGEFWYELKLKGVPAIPTRLPQITATAGDSASHTFTVSNPMGEALPLTVRFTNGEDFRLTAAATDGAPQRGPEALVLPPFGDLPLTLRYTPSAINIPAEVTISISNPQMGELLYEATGVGTPPDARAPAAPVAEVEAALGQPQSSAVSFTNPFGAPLTLSCRLEQPLATPGAPPAFRLLRKAASLVVQPKQAVQLLFAFQTEDMSERAATVLLDAKWEGRMLTWAYPLSGVAVSRPLLRPISLQTRARSPLAKQLVLPLPGLETGGEEFSLELDAEAETAELLSRTLRLTPATDLLKPTSLSVALEWSPLRPMRASAAIVVSKASGGRWRYELLLEAVEPEPDDVIQITASLHKPAAVSFRLPNAFDTEVPFTAYFTPDSASVFSVQPAGGVLSPPADGGTLFTITYAPTEYGKPLRGRLVVSTAEVMWLYEVRGTHPVYQPPEVASSSLDLRRPAGARPVGAVPRRPAGGR